MRLFQLLTVSALALSLGACAGSGTQIPSTDLGVVKSFKPIPNSKAAPCVMQKAVAEHNSVLATLTTGKETVYAAPCEADKPKGSAPARVAALANG